MLVAGQFALAVCYWLARVCSSARVVLDASTSASEPITP